MTYSAQFRNIAPQPQLNDTFQIENNKNNNYRKKLSQNNQEFINNIAVSGFKQFHV